MTDENLREYKANDEITITFKNEPGLKEFFEQWSLMVPTLFLLDICVVSATKLDRSALDKNDKKAKYLDYLRKNDLEHNCFSYMCALMEKVSDSRELMTPEQIKEQLIVDINSLRAFFKNARVYESDEFILEFADELMGQPIEINRDNLLKFLTEINNNHRLYDTIAPKLRLAKVKEIIEQANKLQISVQHPVVLITLATLYGNLSAKKLIKFKADPDKFQAENALADIMLISRIAKFKLEIEYYGVKKNVGYPRVSFITVDAGLNDISESFKAKVVQHRYHEDGSDSKYTFNVKLDKLFIEADSSEINDLSELLLDVDEIHF